MLVHDAEMWETVLPRAKQLSLAHRRCHIAARRAAAALQLSGLRGTISTFAASSGTAGPERLVELP
jgi:hypothetical protein